MKGIILEQGSIVDQAVQRAESVPRLCYKPLDICGLSKVGLHDGGMAATRGEFSLQRLRRFRRMAIMQGDAPALFRKRAGNGPSDTPARSGYQRVSGHGGNTPVVAA